VEGQNGSKFANPNSILANHLLQLETPLAETPVREVANDNSAAWTTRRKHYICICHCFLRDVTRLVDKLSSAGFIGGRQDASDHKFPTGSEYCAALLPFELFYTTNEFSWFSPNKEIRTSYFSFSKLAPSDSSQSIAYNEEDSLNLIAEAENALLNL